MSSVSPSPSPLLLLPLEILEEIVAHSCLSLPDIFRLSQTCRLLHELITSSWPKIWKSRWDYRDCCAAQTMAEWRQLCVQCYLCQNRTRTILDRLSVIGMKMFLLDDEDMEPFCEMIGEDFPHWYSSNDKSSIIPICSRDVLLCTLRNILGKNYNQVNLTHQFYAQAVYEFLQRQRLVEKWKRLLSLPEELQQMEAGAVLVAQWIDPYGNTTASCINQQLDEIATEVAMEILESHEDGKGNCCLDNLTAEGAMERIQVLDLPRSKMFEAVNTVLYTRKGFRPASQREYYQRESSLIDKVLQNKHGIPISLSTVYQSVAGRLGIRLFPVNFPSHFLLKAPHIMSGNGTELPEVFIDSFNRGAQLNRWDCLALVPFMEPSERYFRTTPHYEVYIRMVANLYSRGSLMFGADIGRPWDEQKQQWGPLVLPSAFSLQLHLSSSCPFAHTHMIDTEAVDAATMSLNLNYNSKLVEEILSRLPSISSSSPVLHSLIRSSHSIRSRKEDMLREPVTVHHRDPAKVCYTIGMIMKHKRYDYHCVIYGWDLQCEMSQAWIVQMGVDRLPLGPFQPFYNVLVEDGSNRYAAQESLFPCPKNEVFPIRHWEVGKYFSSYTGNAYIPNPPLREKYSD